MDLAHFAGNERYVTDLASESSNSSATKLSGLLCDAADGTKGAEAGDEREKDGNK